MEIIGNLSPPSEGLQKKQEKGTTAKVFFALNCILMTFLLFQIANPDFEVTVVSVEGQMEAYTISTVDPSYVFNIPKKLWIADTADRTYLSGLIADNNKRVAEESGFEPFFVNRDNFRPFLSQSTIEKVESFIAMIERKIWGKK